MTIIGALLVSVVSYAQTAPASASNVITCIGISGGSGRPIPQEIPGSADLISVALSGSTTLTVNNTIGFISGDYVRIDDGTVHGYYTVATVSEDSITFTPPLATSFAAGGTTSIKEQAVSDRTPTWNPIIGATYTTAADVFEQAPNASGATWSPSVGGLHIIGHGRRERHIRTVRRWRSGQCRVHGAGERIPYRLSECNDHRTGA